MVKEKYPLFQKKYPYKSIKEFDTLPAHICMNLYHIEFSTRKICK